MNINLNLEELKLNLEKQYSRKILKLETESKKNFPIKLNVYMDNKEEKLLWLEYIKQNKTEEIFNTLQKLYFVFKDKNTLGFPKPVCYCSNYIVYEDISNAVRLDKVVFNYTFYPIFLGMKFNKVKDLVTRCAEWLVIFQNITLQKNQQLGYFLQFLNSKTIENDLLNLSKIGLSLKFIEIFRKYFDIELPKMHKKSFEIVGCHGDFSFKNFLIDNKGKIFGVDFETFEYRTRYDDLACFGIYMDLLPAKYIFVNENKIQEIKKLFYEKYEELLHGRIEKDILRFFEFRYLIHITGNEFRLASSKVGIARKIYFKRLLKLVSKWALKI